MRGVFVIAALAALGIVAACVGSDPAVVEAVGSGGDAASSADAGGSADAGAEPPIYGIFLSSKVYRTDFASEMTPAGARAYVDKECSTAASAAGLFGAERYGALIAATPEGPDNADLPALAKALNVADGRWCRIRPIFGGGLAGCTASEAIFASVASLKLGPDNSLTTDENGVPATTERGEFLSGLVVTPGTASVTFGRIRNCLGWHTSVVSDASAADQDAGSDGLGSVAKTPNPTATEYLWLTEAAVRCDAGYQRPLLCIQHP